MGTVTVYASALDVSNFLLNETDFDSNSLPNASLIERFILKAEADFERLSGTAFKPILRTNEIHHVKAYKSAYRETYSGLAWSQPRPVQLNYFPIIPFSSSRGHKIEVFDGESGTFTDTTPEGSWTDYITSRTQGRENDWWYDAMQGVLYFRKSYLFRQNKLLRVTYEYGQPITLLNGSLTSSATTITVDSTYRYPTRGQIRINNEWIHYTGKTATTFTGCSRGQLHTQAAAHPDNDEVYWIPQDVHGLIVQRAASLFLQNENYIATVPEGTKLDMGLGRKVEMWNQEWKETMARSHSRWYLI